MADYQYNWSILQGSEVLVSGTHIGALQVSPGARLLPGTYLFRLTAMAPSGASAKYPDYSFTVVPGVEIGVPELPDPGDIPGPDIIPVTPALGDLVRYLPQWMAAQKDTEPASLSRQFFLSQIEWCRQMSREEDKLLSWQTTETADGTLPRLAWHLSSTLRQGDYAEVVARVGDETFTVRHCASTYDFLAAMDPVFLLGETGQIVFRNLAITEEVVSPVGESGAEASQYHLSSAVIADAPLEYYYGDVWLRLRSGSSAVLPRLGEIQLPEDYTGEILFRYHAADRRDTVEVSVNGGPFHRPDQIDLWNRFDELGLLAGFDSRRPGEDNIAFRTRVASRLRTAPAATPGKVERAIGQDLLLTEAIVWDGRSALDLLSQGYYGVRHVEVLDLPRTGSAQETLTSLGDGKFAAGKSRWTYYRIFVDGMLDPEAAPTFTGSILDLGEVEGTVSAHYLYQNYTLVKTTTDAIAQIVPVPENMPAGTYTVLVTRYAVGSSPIDTNYRSHNLLDAAGNPTQQFIDIRDRILVGSRTHLGRSAWGSTTWFSGADVLPLKSYLDSPFSE